VNTRRILCLTAAAALSLSACGGAATESEPDQAAPATAQSGNDETSAASVSVKNIAFKPADMKVLRGTEVTWTNDDDVAHTATSGQPGTRAVSGVSKGSPAKLDGLFDGDLAKAGATYRFTFNETGTFAYFCEIHPSMTGEIVVE
jgi:plastocyanin